MLRWTSFLSPGSSMGFHIAIAIRQSLQHEADSHGQLRRGRALSFAHISSGAGLELATADSQ
jgi:hypothetical protein